jgi:hypothetical protein
MSSLAVLSRATTRTSKGPNDLARDPLPTIRRWQAPAKSSPVGREQAGDGVDPLKGGCRREQGLRAETGHCRKRRPDEPRVGARNQSAVVRAFNELVKGAALPSGHLTLLAPGGPQDFTSCVLDCDSVRETARRRPSRTASDLEPRPYNQNPRVVRKLGWQRSASKSRTSPWAPCTYGPNVRPGSSTHSPGSDRRGGCASRIRAAQHGTGARQSRSPSAARLAVAHAASAGAGLAPACSG